MTNKEQIIIDGIDVSECDHFREGYCHPGTGVCYKCDTNCQYAAFYLKEQLARKTQECEELERRNKLLLIKGQEGISKRAWAYEQCKKRENRYRKALEEIEKKCCAVLNGNEKILYAYQIKDIINNAKGEENE